MTNWVVKIFPLCAVLFSVFACIFPGALNQLGFLIVPLLGFIMLGMGATLSVADFAKAAKNLRGVLIGLFLQFLLMPLLAYLTGKLLQLPEELFIGLVMVGSVAGGTASNVIAYLAGGNVALSITMTACTTAAGIFFTPLLCYFYLGKTVDVPVFAMFESIVCVVAFPVACGLIINRLCRKKKEMLNKICPVVSVIGIVFVIGIIVSLNVETLFKSGVPVLAAVILHNISGMAAGYAFSRLCKCDKKTAVTIAIEVGMQNSGLAAALSKQFFGIASALPGAVFSIWHNISGAVFAAFAQRKIKE